MRKQSLQRARMSLQMPGKASSTGTAHHPQPIFVQRGSLQFNAVQAPAFRCCALMLLSRAQEWVALHCMILQSAASGKPHLLFPTSNIRPRRPSHTLPLNENCNTSKMSNKLTTRLVFVCSSFMDYGITITTIFFFKFISMLHSSDVLGKQGSKA